MESFTAFKTYGQPLETVISFRYLGRILTATNNDWLGIISNIQNILWRWARLSRILGWEGADTWTLGRFYLDII